MVKNKKYCIHRNEQIRSSNNPLVPRSAEYLERIERHALSSVQRKCLASDVPRTAGIGLVWRRTNVGSTVVAKVGSHFIAGAAHGEVERATARETDAGRAGWTTDRKSVV